MNHTFQNVLIYGMGMMGASLAHSIRKHINVKSVSGVVRTQKSAAFIEGHKIANEIFIHDHIEMIQEMDLSQYDLVILGIPPKSIVSMVPLIPNCDTLISDMSSTRRHVHNAFAKRPDLNFIGSHPMCGSENSGPSAALPDLFVNHLCLIIQNGLDQSPSVQKMQNFWHSLGMKTSLIGAKEHDEVLAYLSHGPHIISSLLTHWASSNDLVKKSTNEAPIAITGGGFRSMARIAGSNPEMWTHILNTNGDNIVSSLKNFHSMLGDLLEAIPQKDDSQWHEWFGESRKQRNFLCNYIDE